MDIRNLGGSGLRVSAVGLGCNNFGQRTDLETSRKVIHKAIDLGITLFDTADIYAGRGGSETVLGEVLGHRRKDIVLATKYAKAMSDDGTKQGASRRYIMTAVEDSLRRLKTDYIDLYQQHDFDPLTPIEETLRALEDLIRQGKVRYIGCSNFPAWRVAEAQFTARGINTHAFVSCQDEYSLIVRDNERTCFRQHRPTISASCRSSRWRADCSPESTNAALLPLPIRVSPRCSISATAT
jgi:aryl-alcohol dehydrogenase-like predicted oxidoreductase